MKRQKHVLVSIFLVLLGFSVSAASQERPSGSPSKTVWTADEPMCPLPDTNNPHGFSDREPYRFKQYGRIDEPRFVQCGDLNSELYRCTGTNQMKNVFELLISRDGIVEQITSLRPHPDCWTEEVARYFRTCKFEPATLDGSAICVTYIVSLSVGLQ
jgi:hypothetical protein